MNYKKNYERGGALYSLMNQGAEQEQMASGGRLYRFGGRYENGGVHGDDKPGEAEVRVMVKDSYNTTTDPLPGQDYIIMVNGQPTDYSVLDMPNFFRSEGLGGPQLENAFYEVMGQFPKGARTPEEEQAYRKEQFNKSLADVGAIARGDGDKVQTVNPGVSSKYDLGKRLKMVRRGGEAVDPDPYSFETAESKMKFAPSGQKGAPKNVNADEFLRALGSQSWRQ